MEISRFRWYIIFNNGMFIQVMSKNVTVQQHHAQKVFFSGKGDMRRREREKISFV